MHFLERGEAPERLLAFSRKAVSVCLGGCDDEAFLDTLTRRNDGSAYGVQFGRFDRPKAMLLRRLFDFCKYI